MSVKTEDLDLASIREALDLVSLGLLQLQAHRRSLSLSGHGNVSQLVSALESRYWRLSEALDPILYPVTIGGIRRPSTPLTKES